MLFITACGQDYKITNGVIEGPSGSESRLDVQKHSTYYITSERTELLEATIKVWNDPLGFELFKFGHGDFEISFENDPNYSSYRDRSTPHDENHAGTFRRANSCRILMNLASGENASLDHILLAHELGHCLGFKHSTFDLSIMYPLLWLPEQSITSGILELL